MTKASPRDIPSIEVLVQKLSVIPSFAELPRAALTFLVRRESALLRKEILKGKSRWNEDDFAQVLKQKARQILQLSLVKAVNATGVVLHTNLGRAPLAKPCFDILRRASESYSTLEYDVENGKRGSRHAHIGELLKVLCGAEDGFAVNNNAAAVLLVLNTLAEGKEVLISRGELVEIGASFRIPDIMSKSGAVLKEVGTTNKTKLSDYEKAITKNTGMILKVHPSNFRITGFTQTVELKELAALGVKRKVAVMEDLGSGCLFDLKPYGLAEPLVTESVKSGAAVVTFSGDKLLGGPQAGIIAGKSAYLEKIKKNPLARALRIDKLSLCALENTLRIYALKENPQDEIPVLQMLTASPSRLHEKARQLAETLQIFQSVVDARIEKVSSLPGGGSLPDAAVESYAVALHPRTMKVNQLEEKLRKNIVPVIARIEKNRLLLDVRTVREEEFGIIKHALDVVFHA